MAQKVYNVIKYEGGDNRVLVYKTEITDFSNESVIIVDESQQALLYKDGQAEGPFTSGRHVLPTNNISLFRKLFARLFRRTDKLNENTPFTCDVYFVNTVNDVSIDWGTPSRTMVKDPVYNELVNVGANGNVKIKVSDPMRFVVNMNGKMGGYTIERLTATVRGEIMTVIKTYIAEIIVNQQVSLLEIQTKLLDLSKSVERKLNERLVDFGLEAVHLNIMDISVDAESQKRLLERQRKINARSDLVLDAAATTDADVNRTIKMANAQAAARQVQGYTYQEERAWDVQEAMAKNPNMGRPPVMGAQPVYPMSSGMMPNMMPPMMQGMMPPMYPYGMG
ncbi:MAG: SPFH domain-containing protein, partial [Clostridiales bacterium]|nr:SPFH domain-containing protein [Clostridiales bacterium]